MIDLTQLLGPVILPVNATVELQTDLISLTGSNSLWGRTIVFEGARLMCGTIQPVAGVETATARLPGPIAGSVTVTTWRSGESDQVDTRILTDLYHVGEDSSASSNHVWKIYVTDVLDTWAGASLPSNDLLC